MGSSEDKGSQSDAEPLKLEHELDWGNWRWEEREQPRGGWTCGRRLDVGG